MSHRKILSLILVAFVSGIGCTNAVKRFPPQVAKSFAHDDMRLLETERAEIYYPSSQRESAERIAKRLEFCFEKLREKPVEAPAKSHKALIFLTSANFNNAYVTGQSLGEPIHAVLPTHMSTELFNLLGQGATGIGDIGCHEL